MSSLISRHFLVFCFALWVIFVPDLGYKAGSHWQTGAGRML